MSDTNIFLIGIFIGFLASYFTELFRKRPENEEKLETILDRTQKIRLSLEGHIREFNKSLEEKKTLPEAIAESKIPVAPLINTRKRTEEEKRLMSEKKKKWWEEKRKREQMVSAPESTKPE